MYVRLHTLYYCSKALATRMHSELYLKFFKLVENWPSYIRFASCLPLKSSAARVNKSRRRVNKKQSEF